MLHSFSVNGRNALMGRPPLNSEIMVPDSWLEKSETPRKTFWLAQGQEKNMPARTEFITREGNFHHEKLGFLTVEMAGHREVGHEVSKRTAKKARCCLHICQIVHHTPVAVLLRHGLTIPHSHGNCGLILKLTNLGAHLWVFNVFHFIFREGSLHASAKFHSL